MKYYIIAGERSGDLHGANLIRELRKNDPQAEVRCWGGDAMAEAGGDLVKHYRDLAFMGFYEVFTNLGTILGNIKRCKKDILDYQPDVLILIDYPGFNLRIAKFAHKSGIKTFYYISPKIWAWNTGRAKQIKANVDRMFVILPFEKDFYRSFDYEVDYVGNPLLDAVRSFEPDSRFASRYRLAEKPVIAVLPGSRKQEVLNILSVMMDITSHFPEFQFLVAAVDNLPASLYAPAEKLPNVEVVVNKTYDILEVAQAAIVTSGTATLETALFEVPQVVCYKTSQFTYTIAKNLIKVPYISLVNLIAQKAAVPELIQRDLNPSRLTEELKKLVADSPERKEQLQDYQALKAVIGDNRPSEEAAKRMVSYLNA